ncbi:DUF4397 domain-containing protein [uncultured Friedmanniella sp.]|uniref:DUF4397 domain-containing protein n=1 Tax=uncultured Friedmanniella sp. TaxID=335381 RepID=UPI0035C9BBB5
MTTKIIRRWGVLALVAVATIASTVLTTGPSYAADSAKVYVVQGLPGKTVDVAFDGHVVARGIKTAKVVGPFPIKSGQRKVTFSDNGKVLLERMFSVKPKSSWDVVVHLPAESKTKPAVTVFRNDLTAVPSGKAELVVAHTAQVPPADIRVDGKVLFKNVANGESLNLVVPVQTYKVAISPAGKSSPVLLGPVDLTVKGGALNRVYALGDPEDNTMNVAVHVIPTGNSGSSRPDRVDTGTGGQAAGVRSLASFWR